MPSFERLSALDASFLELEDAQTPMHLAATLVFDAAPLLDADGAVEMGRIRAVIASRLHQTPRLRMRIARTRLSGHPVWVDDAHFQLDYHLRHVALPPPGRREALHERIGQLLSQPLDRGKPLWEIHVVQGLAGNRVAAICKMHHCLMDGMAGVGVMSVLLSPFASSEIPAAPPWTPRPAPGADALLLAEIERRIVSPRSALRLVGGALRDPWGVFAATRESVVGFAEMVSAALTPSSETPLNREIGPHRRFQGLRIELDPVKQIKKRLGGTVNDVVVAAVAGAMRRFLGARGVDVDALRFRAMMPVNLRGGGDGGVAGNRIGAVAEDLPVSEPSARRRYERVREATAEAKASRITRGTDVLNWLGDWTHPRLCAEAQRLAIRRRAYNVVITNIPGPQVPLYALEAPMLEVYPALPLWHNQALGVAVFSYAGSLFWGFNAERELVPDLGEFVAAVADELVELQKVAGTG